MTFFVMLYRYPVYWRWSSEDCTWAFMDGLGYLPRCRLVTFVPILRLFACFTFFFFFVKRVVAQEKDFLKVSIMISPRRKKFTANPTVFYAVASRFVRSGNQTWWISGNWDQLLLGPEFFWFGSRISGLKSRWCRFPGIATTRCSCS